MLLHDGRSDDLVKSFFRDVYELYLRVRGSGQHAVAGAGLQASIAGCALPMQRVSGRPGGYASAWLGSLLLCVMPGPPAVACPSRPPQVMLNPFHTPTSKITAPLFHHKVRQLARNYFR